jgi:hypothetical protein
MLKSMTVKSNYIEILLHHPLSEIGAITMLVFKLDNEDVLFSIPHHHWSILKSELNKVPIHLPGSFKYSPYKEELRAIMDMSVEKGND